MYKKKPPVEPVLRKDQVQAIVGDRKTALDIITKPEIQNGLKNLFESKMKDEDVYLLIDGSGSMSGKPLQNGLALACLLGKSQTQTNLWGDKNVVKNWVNPYDVTSLQRASNGLASGTSLAPALLMVLNDVSVDKAALVKKKRIIIVSDGDLHDIEQSKTLLAAIKAISKDVKVDVLMSNELNGGREMEALRDVSKNVNVIKFDNWDDLYTSYYEALSGTEYVTELEAMVEKGIDGQRELKETISALRQQFNETTKQLYKMSEQIDKLERMANIKKENTSIILGGPNMPNRGCWK